MEDHWLLIGTEEFFPLRDVLFWKAREILINVLWPRLQDWLRAISPPIMRPASVLITFQSTPWLDFWKDLSSQHLPKLFKKPIVVCITWLFSMGRTKGMKRPVQCGLSPRPGRDNWLKNEVKQKRRIPQGGRHSTSSTHRIYQCHPNPQVAKLW